MSNIKRLKREDLILKQCSDCPNMNFRNDYSESSGYFCQAQKEKDGIHYRRLTDPHSIPFWCPLPNKDLVENLPKEFPQLFKDCYCGCDAESGWYPLLHKLCSDIINFCEKINLGEEQYPQIAQIKEKFGGLRLYYDFSLEFSDNENCFYKELNDMVDKAEKDSTTICEYCGQPGTISSKKTGWLKCMCETCKTEQ